MPYNINPFEAAIESQYNDYITPQSFVAPQQQPPSNPWAGYSNVEQTAPGVYTAYVNGQPVASGSNLTQIERQYNDAVNGTHTAGIQGAPSAPAMGNPTASIQPYAPTTSFGGKSVDQMRNELRAAGYAGPWDDASVQATYSRTVNGGNAGARAGVSVGGNNEWMNLSLETLKMQQAYNQALLQGASDQRAFEIAMGVAQLGGPSNAFQQQAYLHGINEAGFSRAVDAISGKYGLPSFQAPQAQIQPMTMQTIADQLRAGGTAGANTKDYLAALPAPNKIVAPQWLALDSPTQQMLLSGYRAAGYDPNDVIGAVGKTLPQFKAPSFGAVG